MRCCGMYVASKLRVDCRLPALGGDASESQREVVEGHTPLLWIDMLPFGHISWHGRLASFPSATHSRYHSKAVSHTPSSSNNGFMKLSEHARESEALYSITWMHRLRATVEELKEEEYSKLLA
ncbi:hypothetical protein CBL_11836 [Carabus blaptoides fortunei]